MAGATELCKAVEEHNESRVIELLKQNVDPNKPNERGETALRLAVQHGFTGMVALLLSHKANPNQVVGSDRVTLLHYACRNGHELIAIKLMEWGALFDEKTGRYGNTPLHFAVHGGHLSIVEKLLQFGANIELRNGLGRSPVSMAVELGNTQMYQLLVAHGAKTDPSENEKMMSANQVSHENFAVSQADSSYARDQRDAAVEPWPEYVHAGALPQNYEATPFAHGEIRDWAATVMNAPAKVDQTQTVRRDGYLSQYVRTTAAVPPDHPSNRPPASFTTALSQYSFFTRGNNAWIGGGAFGQIYRFEDREGKQVAVKCLRILDDSWRCLVEQEVEVLRQLGTHDTIVQFLDWVSTDEWGYVVMESLGQPLSALIPEKGYRSVGRINKIILKILHGLKHIHEKGFVHCDIKPANVVYDSKGQVKLVDFGATVAIGFPVQAYTPAYAPPKLDGNLNATPAFDVWSLGILCYVLWSGQLPDFAAQPIAANELLEDKLTSFFGGISDSLLLGFLMLCLVAEPQRRATIGALMGDSFCAAEEPRGERVNGFTDVPTGADNAKNTEGDDDESEYEFEE